MSPVISMINVSKSFSYWDDRPTSIKGILANLLAFRIETGRRRRIGVLENVSFDIYPGDFVGIMGRNGAGKSTMLKMISGIYKPTAGTVRINGAISPLLELGAGFVEDLSGFDNIFLNAAILGFGRERTRRSLSAIIDFSELGERIHMPVRSYSSGMLVRLGFSIAVHLDAPILLFDEILAVGDVAFQQKSLEKIMELHAKGRTIILVTHSPEQVEKHCNRCIVIDGHHKVYDGKPAAGVNVYRERCSQV